MLFNKLIFVILILAHILFEIPFFYKNQFINLKQDYRFVSQFNYNEVYLKLMSIQPYLSSEDQNFVQDIKNFFYQLELPDIETKFIDNFKKQFNQFLKSVQENQNELTKNKIQMGEKILKYYLQIVNSVQSTQNDFQLSESQKKVNIIKTVNDQLKQQSYEKDKITLQNMLNKTFKFDNLKPFQQLMQDLQSIILYETNEKFELYSKKINKQYVLNQNLQLTNQTDKIQKGSKIDKIMNLILNNTNNCNQTCFNSFTNQFLDIEDLVESLEFPNKENSPKNAQINDNNEGLSTTKNNQQNQTNQLNLLLTNNNLSSILSYLDYDDQQTYSKIKKFYKLLNSTMFQRQSDSFLNDVIETLNKIQNNQNRLIEETIQNSIEYLQYSNQQFGSKEFQQVLQNSSLSHDEKKTRIQQMYFQNLAQKTKHQQHQILENSQKLDLDQQNILKESILLQLDLISQESTNKMLTHSQNIKQYFKNIILKQKSINQLQKGSNVEKIINLITTNENLCDKNCTNSFSDQLLKIEGIIESLEFPKFEILQQKPQTNVKQDLNITQNNNANSINELNILLQNNQLIELQSYLSNDDQMLIQDIKQVYGYKLENSVSQQFKKFFEILQQNFNETINNFINKQNKQFDDITQVVIKHLNYYVEFQKSQNFKQIVNQTNLTINQKQIQIQQNINQYIKTKTNYMVEKDLLKSNLHEYLQIDTKKLEIFKKQILLQFNLINSESINYLQETSKSIYQYLQNIIPGQKETLQTINKGSNLEKIINLFSQIKHCDQNYKNKIIFEFQKVGEIIDSLNFPNDECQLKKSQVYFDLSSLNEDQQIHLQILISKMQEFNDIYKQKYGDIIHSEIDPQIQLSSHNFIEYLLNNKMINREKIVKIKQLLRIFPILDFENFYLLQTHQNTKFEISNHNKAYGQLKVFRSSESSAYFVKIFQNKTYELILGFGISNHICFGFQIQQKIFNYQIDGIYYYSNESACNRLLIQKGKCLETKFLDKYSHLQVKINVQKQFIQISDYPSNENINILNKEQFEIFQINAEYYFSIGLFYNTQGVSEIQIVEFKEIQE